MHSLEELERALRRLHVLVAITGAADPIAEVQTAIDQLVKAWGSRGIAAVKDREKNPDVLEAQKAAHAFLRRVTAAAGDWTIGELREQIAAANTWASPPLPELGALALEQLVARVEQLGDVAELAARVARLESTVAQLQRAAVQPTRAEDAPAAAPSSSPSSPPKNGRRDASA